MRPKKIPKSELSQNEIDFGRIIQLVEIIKRYEFLVEYLLKFPMPHTLAGCGNLYETIEQTLIKEKLRETGGNVKKAARLLECERYALMNRMRRYNIDREDT